MGQVLAFDFSFADIDFEEAAQVGYVGAIGYFSTTPGKDWSAERVAAAHAAGLGIAGGWETTSARATQGRTAGIADAHQAIAEAQAIGYPLECPIYFAVDETTAWADVAAYFEGAMSVEGIIVGAYGSDAIVNGAAAAGVPYRWQSEAWSGSVVSSAAHLYQRVSPSLTIPGGGYDEDVVLVSAYPWWTAAGVSAPATPPPPTITTAPIEGGTVALAQNTVTVPTDSNGNGWVQTDIPWSSFVAATMQGSDPTAKADDAYWPGTPHVQNRGNAVLVSIVGFLPHDTATVFIATAS